MPYNSNLYITQIAIILVLIWLVSFFIKINSSIDIKKRFEKFSVKPIDDHKEALLDKVAKSYRRLKLEISKILLKSNSFKEYSKKYDKYVVTFKRDKFSSINFVSTKFIWAVIGIIIIILSSILRGNAITLYRISLFFLIGFFVPDIFWISKDKYRKKQIEKDMLKAIIIMNNSFKSGLSIMQAIYMVSNELEGAISEEFKKMYVDISFGLDMDLVFDRFAKRVNTEEARYITTSLSVLNKTGGNIVQVFSSVERSAFTRKKLKEELDALASSAKAIYKILIAVPALLSIVIMLLNPKYFAPLFVTASGRVILGLILIIYFAYIYIIRKIVNMEE